MGNWDLGGRRRRRIDHYEANEWKFLNGTLSTVANATKDLRKQIRGIQVDN